MAMTNAPVSAARDDYKDRLFYYWYNSHKPSAVDFFSALENHAEFGLQRPSMTTLIKWIKDEYRPRANDLDEDAREQLNKESIAAKVAMLQRHQEVATEMQTLSVEFIREHKDDLSITSAIKLLELSITLERDSVGIPDALRKLHEKSDDEIRAEVEKLLTSGELSGLDEFDSE